ncbi:hypothetical protein G6F56_012786 [Rhizopus delemar]|nr:hypothetical protein G6F56_012786 [Rhizopus delemar]
MLLKTSKILKSIKPVEVISQATSVRGDVKRPAVNGLNGAPMVSRSVPLVSQHAPLPNPVSGVQPQINEVVPPKKRNRGRARRLPVKVKARPSVWDLLDNTNAGLSVAALLAMDKTTQRNLVDGIRFLRESYGKNKNVGAPVVSKAGAKRVGRKIAQPMGALPMEVNVVDKDTEVDTDGPDWDSLYSDEEPAESWSGSESEQDDDMSVYGYPYSLDRMQTSSPLKGRITINGKHVEAVFDTGASVNVIGRGLADSLCLVPNGDLLPLSE